MVGLHGWQDNANTFSTLLPQLNVSSFLGIDAPGHGLSSHLPPGKIYNFMEYVIVFRRVVKYFNWKKFSIFGHSFGSTVGYVYASLYPEEVKSFISFECARTLLMMYTVDLASTASAGIDKVLKIEKQLAEKPRPTYKLSDMAKGYSQASLGSVTPESALILLQRGACPAEKVKIDNTKTEKEESKRTDLTGFVSSIEKKHQLEKKALSTAKYEEIDKANVRILEAAEKNVKRIKDFQFKDDNKFYFFTRDPRIKVNAFGAFNEELITECAKNIKCPVLSMRSEEGFLHGTTGEVFMATNDVIKNNNYLEHHEVKGSHHAHLNNPENLAPIINNFLKNYNP